jgi:imidazolonepropionase-like amidohydrolase
MIVLAASPGRWRRRFAASLMLATVAVGCAAPAAQPVARGQIEEFPAVVIRDTRVFDGERVIPTATVVLADRRIVQVALPGEPVEVPEGADVVDGAGKTLLPGLIDAHTHSLFRYNLQNAVAFGVTSHLDMFTGLGLLRAMKDEQTAGGAANRADLISAGTLVTAPGGHGTQYGIAIPTLSGAGEAQEFIDARIAEGSDYIKIVYDDGGAFGMSVPTLDLATLRAAIGAAHARDKLAVVHIGSAASAREAIASGADGLVHAFADRPPEPDFGRLVAEAGAFVVPTLAVLENASGEPGGAAVVTDPVLGPRLFPQDVQNLGLRFPQTEGNRSSLANALEVVRLLHEAGVTLLAGTDAPNPGTTHGASLHRELELLVRAGLTPQEALTAATSTAADAFGLTDRGRIVEGRRADVVLVDGDPTADILQTRDVVGIWKEGRRYKIELYIEEAVAARAATQAELGGPPPPGGESGLVSDFDEPGAIGGAPGTRFGAGWETFTDAPAGASTVTLEVVAGGAEGSAAALAIRGALEAGGRPPFAGAMFRPAETASGGANLSSFAALSFRARGDGGSYKVLLYKVDGNRAVASQAFLAGREWTEFVVPFAEHGTDGRAIRGVLFSAVGDPRSFSFTIDSVRFR